MHYPCRSAQIVKPEPRPGDKKVDLTQSEVDDIIRKAQGRAGSSHS
jgi:hypothetical protein